MTTPPATRRDRRRGQRSSAVGVLALGWGLWLMTQQSLSDLLSAGAWFVVPAVLSDLLLLPVVAVIGAALTRHLQPWIRLPAQVALAMIGTLTFVALPFLTGLGKQSDNPSLLNRNYPVGPCGLHPADPVRGRRLGALRRRAMLAPVRRRPHDRHRRPRGDPESSPPCAGRCCPVTLRWSLSGWPRSWSTSRSLCSASGIGTNCRTSRAARSR